MKTTNQKIETEGKINGTLYDLSPLAELLEKFVSPGEYSKILRNLHHGFATLLLEDFMELDISGGVREIQYTNETLNDLFFLKELGDCFEKIAKGNA